jgi:hypothetical protein
MNEWVAVPTARELEAEFGVRVVPDDDPGRFGWLKATGGGGSPVYGGDLAELRDELIKRKRQAGELQKRPRTV